MGSQTVLFNLCPRMFVDGRSFEKEEQIKKKRKLKKENRIRVDCVSQGYNVFFYGYLQLIDNILPLRKRSETLEKISTPQTLFCTFSVFNVLLSSSFM